MDYCAQIINKIKLFEITFCYFSFFATYHFQVETALQVDTATSIELRLHAEIVTGSAPYILATLA